MTHVFLKKRKIKKSTSGVFWANQGPITRADFSAKGGSGLSAESARTARILSFGGEPRRGSSAVVVGLFASPPLPATPCCGEPRVVADVLPAAVQLLSHRLLFRGATVPWRRNCGGGDMWRATNSSIFSLQVPVLKMIT
jgi:hypothetical protein